MTISELPLEVQQQLSNERLSLKDKCQNNPYLVHLYNSDGTRYFYARRNQRCWSDSRGNYMPFGGGSYWTIVYGAVQFRSRRDPFGGTYYEICDGSKTYGKAANGTIIPREVATKKEVMDIAKAIGIFNI